MMSLGSVKRSLSKDKYSLSVIYAHCIPVNNRKIIYIYRLTIFRL